MRRTWLLLLAFLGAFSGCVAACSASIVGGPDPDPCPDAGHGGQGGAGGAHDTFCFAGGNGGACAHEGGGEP